MITLTNGKRRSGARIVPLTWSNTAWSVRIMIRSAAPVLRRLSGLVPARGQVSSFERKGISRGAFSLPLRNGAARGVRGSAVERLNSVRMLARPLRGRISNYRRLACDPAGLSRLAAFSSLPLCRESTPRMRVFCYFQNSQFAL